MQQFKGPWGYRNPKGSLFISSRIWIQKKNAHENIPVPRSTLLRTLSWAGCSRGCCLSVMNKCIEPYNVGSVGPFLFFIFRLASLYFFFCFFWRYKFFLLSCNAIKQYFLLALYRFLAVVIHKFQLMLVNECGGRREFLRKFQDKKLKLSTGPLCCCCVCFPRTNIHRWEKRVFLEGSSLFLHFY